MAGPLLLRVCGKARAFTGTALRPSQRQRARAAVGRGFTGSHSVKVYARDWANPSEDITSDGAEQKIAPEEQDGASETPTDLRCQMGDLVTVSWECILASTGQVLDSSSRGPVSRPKEFQMGRDAGFQPKSGLTLAFSLVAEGLGVGASARVVARPSGGGWFKAYEIFSEDGQLLAQLTQEERKAEWADKETVYTMEVLKIVPPRGRKPGEGRRAYR